MTTITKERIEQALAMPSKVLMRYGETLEMARMLLAGMGHEPVAFIGERILEELTDGARSCGRVWPAAKDELDGEIRIPLYATPQPAPVVPNGWIKCSEQMPEDSGRYWCYIEEQNDLGKSHYQWNCSWNGDRWWIESEGGGRVTHWMPLPEAPQKEDK